ncbi:unnamed protein product [Cyprideis torosa]|uniref:phosphoethanolamine N-methyltransferase n=1 Tax=Cyprideis torosa TaxID=163714 RepID=A0A7R8ZN34_9CRUS|nr:unnamed protein product [Cyprideis torosa]CAG0890506.1 unnamed protein product [Cyprideis torosa]
MGPTLNESGGLPDTAKKASKEIALGEIQEGFEKVPAPKVFPTQEYLDNTQYTLTGILRYEFIFGRCFVSTGGLETTKEVVSRLNLKPGDHVLDIGCGLGGSAFFMASEYGAIVTGLDLSENMLHLARQRMTEQPLEVRNRVSFRHGDILKVEFPEESFDFVYTRDAFIHIGLKEFAFGRIQEYIRCLKTAFETVEAHDLSHMFLRTLSRELKYLQLRKKEFLRDFSAKDFNDLMTGWQSKIARVHIGDQSWGLFIATKSNH